MMELMNGAAALLKMCAIPLVVSAVYVALRAVHYMALVGFALWLRKENMKPQGRYYVVSK